MSTRILQKMSDPQVGDVYGMRDGVLLTITAVYRTAYLLSDGSTAWRATA